MDIGDEYERDLDDFIEEPIVLDDDGHLVNPPVADDKRAAGMAATAARLMAERSRIKATAQARRDLITAWEDDRTGGLTRAITAIEHALRGYVQAMKRGSMSWPAGKAKLTMPRGHIDVFDEETFCSWANGNAPELLRVRYEPKKQDGLDQLPVKGSSLIYGDEIIPGVQWVKDTAPEAATFKFTPSEAFNG